MSSEDTLAKSKLALQSAIDKLAPAGFSDQQIEVLTAYTDAAIDYYVLFLFTELKNSGPLDLS